MANGSPDYFSDYLKAEYNNIAEAHFRTNEAISSFFRYYLLIMSAPITVLAIFVSWTRDLKVTFDVIQGLSPLVFAILMVISFVGFGVMLYILNLRMDAILYARTVNAIRKRYYDKSGIDLGSSIRIRVLPQSQAVPKYFEWRYFVPVIFVFAFFDTLYLVLGIGILFLSFEEATGTIGIISNMPWAAWFGPAVFLLGHFVLYANYARYREHTYLRSFALGVDVDGVLNTHRNHFCKLLKDRTGKVLEPESITTIPLHDCPALGISRDDENRVFNDPRYWVEMPPEEDAAQNLRKIRNLNVKVHVFSHRPWPSTFTMGKDERNGIHDKWHSVSLGLVSKTYEDDASKRFVNYVRLKIGIPELYPLKATWFRLDKHVISLVRNRIGCTSIEQITKWWLDKYKMDYDTLMIEQGNENVADPQGHFRNRFHIARQKMIRYFVEDDIEKANKLAYICDLVFLLRHPYNTGFEEKCRNCEMDCKREPIDLPSNVLTVKSWDEIYKFVRKLS